MKQEPSLKIRLLILAIPILFLSLALWLLNADSEVFNLFFGFEQIGEWVQGVCYLLAVGFGLRGFTILKNAHPPHRAIKMATLLLFTFGMLLIALEELSWGQQILKWDSPQLFLEINAQGETNLHNMVGFNGAAGTHLLFMAIGLYGGLGWVVKSYAKSQIADLLIPDWYFSSFFLPVFLFYFYYDFVRPSFFIIGNVQELFEFVLAFGFLFFSMVNVSKIKRASNNR
jgi:hypothetical protein